MHVSPTLTVPNLQAHAAEEEDPKVSVVAPSPMMSEHLLHDSASPKKSLYVAKGHMWQFPSFAVPKYPSEHTHSPLVLSNSLPSEQMHSDWLFAAEMWKGMLAPSGQTMHGSFQ